MCGELGKRPPGGDQQEPPADRGQDHGPPISARVWGSGEASAVRDSSAVPSSFAYCSNCSNCSAPSRSQARSPQHCFSASHGTALGPARNQGPISSIGRGGTFQSGRTLSQEKACRLHQQSGRHTEQPVVEQPLSLLIAVPEPAGVGRENPFIMVRQRCSDRLLEEPAKLFSVCFVVSSLATRSLFGPKKGILRAGLS